MKRRGRKARIGDITLVMSRIEEGNSKGCWEVEQRSPDGEGGYYIRAWVMWETKRVAGMDFCDQRWWLRLREQPGARGVGRLTLGRRGSRPSSRRARCRTLP